MILLKRSIRISICSAFSYGFATIVQFGFTSASALDVLLACELNVELVICLISLVCIDCDMLSCRIDDNGGPVWVTAL